MQQAVGRVSVLGDAEAFSAGGRHAQHAAQDIAAARAEVAGREADLREAQITYDRNHELLARKAVSQAEVDRTEADATAARINEAGSLTLPAGATVDVVHPDFVGPESAGFGGVYVVAVRGEHRIGDILLRYLAAQALLQLPALAATDMIAPSQSEGSEAIRARAPCRPSVETMCVSAGD